MFDFFDDIISNKNDRLSDILLKKIGETIVRSCEDDAYIDEDDLEPGDIVGCERIGYDHYSVYVGYGCVIHYTPHGICMEPLSVLEDEAKGFFVLDFDDEPSGSDLLDVLTSGRTPKFGTNYFNKVKIYSPEKTIERAKSNLGKDSYNLIFNNCEHFAIWCKTGIKESTQVSEILGGYSNIRCKKRYI